MNHFVRPCTSFYASENGSEQIPTLSKHLRISAESRIALHKTSMASRDRVLSALNFITGEGINYYWDGVEGNDVEALISDYFDAPTDDEDDHMNDDESESDCDHSIEGNFRPSTKACILNTHI